MDTTENKRIEWTTQRFSLPGEVAFNPNLTHVTKIVYWVLDQFRKSPKGIFPSNEYISYLAGISCSSVTSAIAHLISEGYVRRKAFDGRKRVLELCNFTDKHGSYITSFDMKKAAYQPTGRLHTSQLPANSSKVKEKKSSSKEEVETASGATPPLGFDTDLVDNQSMNIATSIDPSITINRRQNAKKRLSKKKEDLSKVILSDDVKYVYSNGDNEAAQKKIIKFWNMMCCVKPELKYDKEENDPRIAEKVKKETVKIMAKFRIPKTKKQLASSQFRGYYKVTHKILPKLLEKHSIVEIEKSIRTYHDLLTDFNILLNPSITGHRVGFHEFLNGFSPRTKEFIYDNNVVRPNVVWFKECLKSPEYLLQTYGKYIKVADESIYDEFKSMVLYPHDRTPAGHPPYPEGGEWYPLNFQELEEIEKKNHGLSIDDVNTLRMATNKLVQFVDTYRINKSDGPTGLLPKDLTYTRFVAMVFRSIADDTQNSGIPITLSWLKTDSTYMKRIPKMLKYRGNLPNKFVPLEMPWMDYRKSRKNGDR
jgi:hypothetical protein